MRFSFFSPCMHYNKAIPPVHLASLVSFVLVANVISNGKNCPEMAIPHNCVSTGFNIKRHSLKSSGTMLVSLFLFLKPSKLASVKQQKCIHDITGEPLMAVCNLQIPQLHCIQKSKWTGEVVRVRDQQKCVKNSGQSGTKNDTAQQPLCHATVHVPCHFVFSFTHTSRYHVPHC